MAFLAKRDTVGSHKHEIRAIRFGLYVVDFQLALRRVLGAAVLASVLVAVKDAFLKPLVGRSAPRPESAFLHARFGSNPIRVSSKRMAVLKTHAVNGWMVPLAKTLVPRFLLACLVLAAIWVVPPFVLGDAQAATFGFRTVCGERGELLAAPALARRQDASFLSLGYTHVCLLDAADSSIPEYTGKEENGVNCWNTPLGLDDHNVAGNGKRDGLKTSGIGAISSQAPEESGEGSTTRAWSPERTVKPHERTALRPQGRYSLGYGETRRSVINGRTPTFQPYTGKLEALSQFSIRQPVETALRNDASKALDTAAHTQFNLAPLRYVGTSTTAGTLTTNGTATATNTSTMNKYHVGRIKDSLAERSVPPYAGNEYVAIGHATTFRALKTDLQAVSQYVTEGYTKIMKGEIGMYEGIRFVEQSHIAKYTTFGASANTNWAYFFGGDTCAEGIVEPVQVRGKIPGDYGRSKGVAWYYLGGFAITHNWGTNDTNAANARILKWDCASAA